MLIIKFKTIMNPLDCTLKNSVLKEEQGLNRDDVRQHFEQQFHRYGCSLFKKVNMHHYNLCIKLHNFFSGYKNILEHVGIFHVDH